MSKYTTELRFICETYAGYEESKGYADFNDVLSKSRSKVFDFDYPIFDDGYKSLLETKILKHFYFREIGFETVSQFKIFLNMRMNEVMPYYNQLYKSELIKFDPMTDHDYQVTGTRKGSGDKSVTGSEDNTRNKTKEDNDQITRENLRKTVSEGSTNLNNDETVTGHAESDTNTTGTKWDYYHDTPQGSVSTLNDQSYLTNARKDTDNTDVGYQGDDTTTTKGKQTGTTNNTDTVTQNDNEGYIRNGTENETEHGDSHEQMFYNDLNDYAEHHFGKSAGMSFSDYLIKFRETFLNIDMMVIGELEELFMGLW